jgi:hypothetical protein
MNQSTSILEPFHATSIHGGLFVGVRPIPSVGHFLTDQISLQECGSIVRQRFFFFFWGELFCHFVSKKLGKTQTNGFCKKKKR